jgi:hypothetical protein
MRYIMGSLRQSDVPSSRSAASISICILSKLFCGIFGFQPILKHPIIIQQEGVSALNLPCFVGSLSIAAACQSNRQM